MRPVFGTTVTMEPTIQEGRIEISNLERIRFKRDLMAIYDKLEEDAFQGVRTKPTRAPQFAGMAAIARWLREMQQEDEDADPGNYDVGSLQELYEDNLQAWQISPSTKVKI